MQYFFDTSAIVKIYHIEAGSAIVLPIYQDNDSIWISELCKVEMSSTLHKKLRNKEINTRTLNALQKKFSADYSERFLTIPITSSLIDAALNLISRYATTNHLLSLDAIQLSTFTMLSASDVSFVCADKRLTFLVKKFGFNALEL